jgi:hypothetical protein
MGAPKAHEQLFRKVLGGIGILPVRRTGWKACATKSGGRGAHRTELFMNYG